MIDGVTVQWPADAWPLPLAHDDDAVLRLAALEWTAGNAAFWPTDPAPIAPDGIVAYAEWDQAQWAAEIGDPALVGFTLITHEDGVLRDADVVINRRRWAFADTLSSASMHRPTTLRHELGHVLGLGHAADVDQVMFASQEPGRAVEVTGPDVSALAAASSCCVAWARPDPDDLASAAFIWAHGLEEVADDVAPVDADSIHDVPFFVRRIEVWNTTGQAALFDPPAPPQPDPRPSETFTGSTADDCTQRPGSAPGGWWILPAALSWTRRRRS